MDKVTKLGKADLYFSSLNNMRIREAIALYEELAQSEITFHSQLSAILIKTSDQLQG